MGALNHLTDINRDAALHLAAYKGHSDLMRLLMYSGMELQKTDNFGSTPLHLACLSGNMACNLMGYQYAHHSMAVPGLLHAIQFCRFSCYIASSINFNELVLASWKKAQEEQCRAAHNKISMQNKKQKK
uniref:Uncharacterized protein n=1 Tax=Glossina palpalis gambiensis TaxID=67801 RepID=A0A1B0APU1_9MUSC